MNEESGLRSEVLRLERAVRILRRQMFTWLVISTLMVALAVALLFLWGSQRGPHWRGDTVIARRFIVEDAGLPRGELGINDHGRIQLILGPEDRTKAGIGLAVMDSSRAQLYVNNGRGLITHLTGAEMTIGREGVIAALGAHRDSGYFFLTGGGRPMVMYPWNRRHLDSILAAGMGRP